MKFKTRCLIVICLLGMTTVLWSGKQLYEIEQFNRLVKSGGIPPGDSYPFEARYAAAITVAKQGRYQDAAQLFSQLLERGGTPAQVAAVHYNLGNIFLLRGLIVNRNGTTVKDEAEFLFNQARLAYEQSLRLDSRHLDVKHNLDRVLSMLPEIPGSIDEQEKPGVVMGSIPTGLP
jgi:mxaK protein